MKLFEDIRSVRVLHFKGWLFLLLALLAGASLILKDPSSSTIFAVLILAWASCRFYYYLFYVLEHYAGRQRKYAGIVDELRQLVALRRSAREEAVATASGTTAPAKGGNDERVP